MQDATVTIKIDSDDGFSVRATGRSDIDQLGKDFAAWGPIITETMFQIKSKKKPE